ncbi:MAG: hypothetical protein J5966_10505 [Lachnospiraceae bacterium]|nr:hypothetical protein [Lachnospiraceae bacterium]
MEIGVIAAYIFKGFVIFMALGIVVCTIIAIIRAFITVRWILTSDHLTGGLNREQKRKLHRMKKKG